MYTDAPSPIKTFTDLKAWQHGHILVLSIYDVTKNFPTQEIFGLTNQLRRAVVSVTSNIAEGFNRRSKKEKIQFFSVALGSVAEIQNQILIAKDICLISADQHKNIFDQSVIVHKLIWGLMKHLKENT